MILLLLSAAFASPLNPWGSATAPGASVVNPYLYVYPEAINPIVYGSVGLSKSVDLYVGYGQLIPKTGAGEGSLEIFPRFFPVAALGLAPHLYWTPGSDSFILAPEVHANFASGRFSFLANLDWKPIVSSGEFTAGSVVLLAAPEVKLSDRLSVYVEVDPSLSLEDDPFALLVVPGFGLTLDPEGRHSLSAGLQVPVMPDIASSSLGLWYCFVIPKDGG